VELFSGQGVVAAELEENGIITTTVDNDPRMKADVVENIEVFARHQRGKELKDFGWASPTCKSFTRTSDRGHNPARNLEGKAISAKAKEGDSLLVATVKYFQETQ
jgi:hypothetical protein